MSLAKSLIRLVYSVTNSLEQAFLDLTLPSPHSVVLTTALDITRAGLGRGAFAPGIQATKRVRPLFQEHSFRVNFAPQDAKFFHRRTRGLSSLSDIDREARFISYRLRTHPRMIASQIHGLGIGPEAQYAFRRYHNARSTPDQTGPHPAVPAR